MVTARELDAAQRGEHQGQDRWGRPEPQREQAGALVVRDQPQFPSLTLTWLRTNFPKANAVPQAIV